MKSTTGYIIAASNVPINWKTQKQSIVATSTLEAEYYAATAAAEDLLATKYLLDDIKIVFTKESKAIHFTNARSIIKDMQSCNQNIIMPLTIYEDNQGAITISKTGKFHERSKHWRLNMYWLKEKVTKGLVQLLYKESKLQMADILMKALGPNEFNSL
jgi:hypothetical protein